MKVLITGGTGFIGMHLTEYHLQRGDSVILLDNFSKTEGKADAATNALKKTQNVELLQIDMTRPFVDSVKLPDLDIVYHLAAINGTRLFYEIPYELARANLLITLNLLDALQGKHVGRLLYTSTSEVYADAEQVGLLKIPTDETVPVVFTQPTSDRFSYATSKFMGEFLCLRFGKRYKIPCSVIRYHNIYGPRMGTKHVIPEFILRVRDRESPFKIYGGDETRAFCHVDDAVKATHLVAVTPACENELVHIGNSEEEISIQELAKQIMRHMKVPAEIVEQGRRSASVSRRCPDTTKLKRLTGFKATIPLQEGLPRTIQWYLANS